MDIIRHPVVARRVEFTFVCTGPVVGDQYHAVTYYTYLKNGVEHVVRSPTGAWVDVVLHGDEGKAKYMAAVEACENIMEVHWS